MVWKPCGLSLLCSSPSFATCSVPSAFIFSIELNKAHVSPAHVLPYTWMPGLCVRKTPTLPSTPWAWISCMHTFYPHRSLLQQSWEPDTGHSECEAGNREQSIPSTMICHTSRTLPIPPCKWLVRVVSQDPPTALPTGPPETLINSGKQKPVYDPRTWAYYHLLGSYI